MNDAPHQDVEILLAAKSAVEILRRSLSDRLRMTSLFVPAAIGVALQLYCEAAP